MSNETGRPASGAGGGDGEGGDGATLATDDLEWEVSLVRPPSESVTLRVTV